MSAEPLTLQSYRLTTDHHLILQLQSGGPPITRRIRLGERDAGLFSYSDLDGLGLFARGRAGGAGPSRPLRGVLLARVSPEQASALATDVWPLMRRLTAEVG